jgi:hypothetical protein
MVTIWKYPLPSKPRFTIAIPRGAEYLTVQVQNGTTQLWALVDPDALKVPHTFRLMATGDESLTHPGQYIGTFQMEGGAIILHLFKED